MFQCVNTRTYQRVPFKSTPTTGLKGLHELALNTGRYFGTSTDELWSISDHSYLALSGKLVIFILL